MIQGFGDARTEDIFHGNRTRRVRKLDQGLLRATIRKLDMLSAAHALEDLRSPPGNRLEALAGDLDGMHSIRVNRQWRIIFTWTAGGPDAVQLTDYHS